MDVSDIFYFFCSGEGKGAWRATGRGGGSVFFLLKTLGGPGGCLQGIFWGGGGGLNIFCFGAEAPAKISVIISPPITTNQFWGFNKRNSQEKLHHPALSLSGKLHNLLHRNILWEFALVINFTSVTPEKSWGINSVILEGLMVGTIWQISALTR